MPKVEIRTHLIPFLMKEFTGKEVVYENTKALSVRFFPSSSISKYLYQVTEYQRKRDKQDEFFLYLTVQHCKREVYYGALYVDKKGVFEPMELEQKQIIAFNDLLEDLFRITLVSFIQGCVQGSIRCTDAIMMMVKKYELEEVGLDTNAIRTMYYREIKKKRLMRMQMQSSNRVTDYETM